VDDLQETGRVSMLITMESKFVKDDDAIQPFLNSICSV